jgi:hypothetical protein
MMTSMILDQPGPGTSARIVSITGRGHGQPSRQLRRARDADNKQGRRRSLLFHDHSPLRAEMRARQTRSRRCRRNAIVLADRPLATRNDP